VTARELERWLLRNNFATTNDTPHTLLPTRLAVEVAGAGV